MGQEEKTRDEKRGGVKRKGRTRERKKEQEERKIDKNVR